MTVALSVLFVATAKAQPERLDGGGGLLLVNAMAPRGEDAIFRGHVKRVTTTDDYTEVSVSYDKNGFRISREERSKRGDMTEKTDYVWRRAQLLAEITRYKDGSTFEVRYEYWPDGRLKRQTFGCPRDCTDRQTSYAADIDRESGRKNTLVTYVTKSKSPAVVGANGYDENGRLVYVSTNGLPTVSSDGSTGSTPWGRMYKWLDWREDGLEIQQLSEGRIERRDYFTADGLRAGMIEGEYVEVYSYVFDAAGNWITQNYHHVNVAKDSDVALGKVFKTVTRRIEYWK